jgi:hypothetical protein
LIVIVLALVQGWSLATLLVVYWFQSVVIGFFNLFRILALKNFSTENLKLNNRPVEPTQGTKNRIAFFFAFHYGMFHLIYLIVLTSNLFATKANIDIFYTLVGAAVFAVNHYFSFQHNKQVDERKKQNIGSLMFMPYVRIVPMHLMAASGAVVSTAPLIIFLLLKTVADLATHTIKHHVNKEPITSSSTTSSA